MFAVYPLHLQKEIDRRWLLRSEETVCGRARLNGLSHFLREAAVTPKNCKAAGSPGGLSSSKGSTTVLAM